MTLRKFLSAASIPPFADWVAGADDTLNTSTGGTASLAQRAPDILNVRDFEPLARATLPPAHFGYLATGIGDDNTLRRNEAVFGDYEIRARRFVDLSKVDTGITLLGAHWRCPVYLYAIPRCARSILTEKKRSRGLLQPDPRN